MPDVPKRFRFLKIPSCGAIIYPTSGEIRGYVVLGHGFREETIFHWIFIKMFTQMSLAVVLYFLPGHNEKKGQLTKNIVSDASLERKVYKRILRLLAADPRLANMPSVWIGFSISGSTLFVVRERLKRRSPKLAQRIVHFIGLGTAFHVTHNVSSTWAWRVEHLGWLFKLFYWKPLPSEGADLETDKSCHDLSVVNYLRNEKSHHVIRGKIPCGWTVAIYRMGHRALPCVRRIDVPTYLCWGGKDEISYPITTEEMGGNPNVTLDIIPNAKHHLTAGKQTEEIANLRKALVKRSCEAIEAYHVSMSAASQTPSPATLSGWWARIKSSIRTVRVRIPLFS